jgi:hypothetical protein
MDSVHKTYWPFLTKASVWLPRVLAWRTFGPEVQDNHDAKASDQSITRSWLQALGGNFTNEHSEIGFDFHQNTA